MFSTLPAAVTGLYRAVSLATQSASDVVNASSTGKNIDEDMVNLNVAREEFAANADVIKTEEKMQKSLLDMKV
jgi:flagellar hook-associated protein FlgK